MATLGEAFISVRADLGPFRRDLEPEVKKAADGMEHIFAKAVEAGIKDSAAKASKEAGDKAGDNLAEGIKKKTGDKDKPPWVNIAAALGGALDDGISALPAEVKAAIVLGILATVPIISAALAGAISAGTALGVVGFGIALASQFETVQNRWAGFASGIRDSLTGAAAPFEIPLLNALDTIQDRVRDLEVTFLQIFTKAAKFVEPFVNGLLNGIEFFLDSLESAIGNSDQFVAELAVGFEVLGSAMGDALEILVNTGEDGAKGLRDLIFLISELVIATAQIIAFFTKFYGLVRDVGQSAGLLEKILLPPLALIGAFTDAADQAADSNITYAHTNIDLIDSALGVTGATKAEEKALKELTKQIKDATEAAFDAIGTQIEWERSLDRLREGFEKNGRTIAIESEEGRQNLENLGRAIRAAQEEAERRLKSGEVNAAQAKQLYDAELAAIYKIAASFGISKQAVDQYYAAAIAAFSIPPPPLDWAGELAYLMSLTASQAERAQRAIWNLDPNRRGGNQPFADGGIVYGPTSALIGEAGAEAVIPLTRPARAAQLLQQSGLDRMLFGGGDISVQVFVGNEELDARTVRIVQASNRRQAQQLSFGTRG